MPSVKRPAPDTLHTLRSSKKPRTELDLSSSAPGRLPTRRSSKQPRTGPKRRRAAKEGRDSANLFQRWAQIGREVWDLGKDTLTQLAIAMEGVRDHDSPRRPRSAPPPQGLKQEPEPVAGPSVLPPQARRKSLSRPPSPPASPGEQNLYADAPENSAPSGPSFPPANNLPPFQRRKSLRTSSESATPSPSSSGRQWDEIPPADGQDHTPPTSTTPGPEVPTTPRRLPPRQRKSLDWMQAESQTPFPVQTVQDPSPTRPAHMPTRTTRNTIHGSTFSTPKTLPHRQRIPVDFTRSVAPPPPSTRRVTAHYSTSHMDVDTPTRHTGAPFSIPGGYPELDAALAASGNRRRVQEITDNIPARKYQSREHIFAKNHKAQLEADRKKAQEELEQELYGYKRSRGYASDFRTFQNYLGYRATLEGLVRRDALSPSPSLTDLRSGHAPPSAPRRRSLHDDGHESFLKRTLQKARQTLNEPKPPKPFIPSFDQLRLSARAKDEEIERRLYGTPFPTKLPDQDDAVVEELLRKRGVISRVAREQVTDKDIARLRPCQWLNDEIINFYGQMILTRSEDCKENPGSKSVNGTTAPGNSRGKPLNVHYFSSFFWSKLKGEGYERSRLAKWTKKFDLFSKDVILIPVNHNNSHWTAAAINFRKKRIESYDSMNMYNRIVWKMLRGYLDAEHRNKKKKPFDWEGWEDYTNEDTPQQENGYDCGVFTCQFLESLSRGLEKFPFQQENMEYLRRRMIWEIGHAKLREEP